MPEFLIVQASVFAGDGAFQMGPQELSTMMRSGVAPLIFVLNNAIYGIEEMIHSGEYNRLKVTTMFRDFCLRSDYLVQDPYEELRHLGLGF